MKKDKMIWFEDLRRRRKAMNLTLGALGKKVGLGPVQMGIIERQESGTPRKRAVLIAKTLHCSLNDLVAYKRTHLR